MKKNSEGVLAPFHSGKTILEKLPSLQSVADISVVEIINIDSTDLDPKVWTRLARIIYEKYSDFDGFVVTHGTDTLAYTASALSFALGNLTKPVVFTGSQRTIDDIPSDAGGNIINSVLLATRDVAGIFIVFGSKILWGSRATKVSESKLEAFDTPMVLPAGEISLELKLDEKFHNRGSQKKHPTSIIPDFNSDIIVISVTPGLNASYLEGFLDRYKGIILKGFGPGNIPTSLLSFLKKAKEREIPVVITSQCQKGVAKMDLYYAGYHAKELGVISGHDMTIEAAAVKLMWILARTRDIKKIRQVFEKNIAGEVTIN